jgi:hypothetical protein
MVNHFPGWTLLAESLTVIEAAADRFDADRISADFVPVVAPPVAALPAAATVTKTASESTTNRA